MRPKNKEEKITFRLPIELSDNFKEYCKINGYSLSKRLRILMENDMNLK